MVMATREASTARQLPMELEMEHQSPAHCQFRCDQELDRHRRSQPWPRRNSEPEHMHNPVNKSIEESKVPGPPSCRSRTRLTSSPSHIDACGSPDSRRTESFSQHFCSSQSVPPLYLSVFRVGTHSTTSTQWQC